MIRRLILAAVGMRTAGPAGGGSSPEGSYSSGGTGYGAGYSAPSSTSVTIDMTRAGGYVAPTTPITMDIT